MESFKKAIKIKTRSDAFRINNLSLSSTKRRAITFKGGETLTPGIKEGLFLFPSVEGLSSFEIRYADFSHVVFKKILLCLTLVFIAFLIINIFAES